MHFLPLLFSRCMLKGSTMVSYTVLTFAEAGESCLSPSPIVYTFGSKTLLMSNV